MEDWPYYQLCNKYEAFPTKQLQEALLLLLTDEEEVLQLRMRAFMALSYQNKYNSHLVPLKRPIWKYGMEAIESIHRYPHYNNSQITSMFLSILLTQLPAHEIKKEFINQSFQLINGINMITLIKECTGSDPKFVMDPEVSKIILNLGLRLVHPDYKIEVAQLLLRYKHITIEDLDYLLLYRQQCNIFLYDFLAHLPEIPEFIRYITIGRQGIETMNREGVQRQRKNQIVDTGKQSVHQLDFHRNVFMKWLLTGSFVTEQDRHKRIIDNWINVNQSRYEKGIAALKAKHHNQFEVLFEYKETIDNISFTKKEMVHLNLYEIFRRIVWIIFCHKNRKELEQRLVEELTEMEGTCLSGHINRLFNTFIGFEEVMNIRDPKEEFKVHLRRELEILSADSKYEKLREAIIMAEWTPELENELRLLGEEAKQESKKQINGSLLRVDQENIYYEVIYKWSGLHLKKENESDTEEE